MRSSLLASAALIMALQAPAVRAQEASVPAAERNLEGEIIVTAQRRSESIQSVPVSVTPITSESISSRNLNDLTQISTAAPSLQIGQDNTFSVRGVGTLAFAQTIDSSVAVALDEVNLGRPFLAGSLFNDVERVEVLNGPQGLLFGKNASAGLLNVVTTRPKLGEWRSITDLELGNRATPGNSEGDAWSVIARETVNIPIGQNSALRVNGIYSYQEPATTLVAAPNGARNDIDLEQYGIRAKYLAEFDALSIYLIGDYTVSTGVAGIFDRTYRTLGTGSPKAGPISADGVTPGPNNFTYGADGGYWRDLDTGGLQANVAYVFPSGIELSNILAWKFFKLDQQLDSDFTTLNSLNVNHNHTEYDQYSNELRLALPSGNRLSGQVGLYYFSSKVSTSSQIAGNAFFPAFLLPTFPFCVGAIATPGAFPPTCSVSNEAFLGRDVVFDMNTRSYAAFGQFTYAVTESLKLIAGARFTHDKIDVDLIQNQRNYFVPFGTSGSIRDSYDNSNLSWKLGAQYQITPVIMAYATYGRGYKGPGFNDGFSSAIAPFVVRPETSNNVEIGLKSSFFDRRLTFNVALFHTKFNDYQSQSFDTVSQAFVIQNAASVTSQGAEFTVIARPAEGLTINASATILDSKFDSFAGAQCYAGQTVPATCPTTGVFDAGGLRTPVTPKFASTVQLSYEIPTSGSVHPFVDANWYHRSSINYMISQPPAASYGKVDLFGASIGLRVDNGMRLALFCKNCTNKHVPNFIGLDAGDSASGVTTSQQQFGPDAVRTIGLSGRFDF